MDDSAYAGLGEASASRAFWRTLPTAWIHFLLVELRHVYLAVFAWQRLVIGISTHVYLENHIATDTTQEVQAYFWSKYIMGYAPAKNVTLGAESMLMLHEHRAVSGFGVVWFLVCWWLHVCAAALILYAVLSLLRECIWSFEEGLYLQFTWQLIKTPWYKRLVNAMNLAPWALMVSWCLGAYLYPKTSTAWRVNLEIMQKNLLSILLLLMSLNLLASPTVPVHYWNRAQMQRLVFRRHPLHLFLGSNANFGLKLVDALWSAQAELEINGHLEGSRLAHYFTSTERAEAALQLCLQMQRTEVQQRRTKSSSLELSQISSSSRAK